MAIHSLSWIQSTGAHPNVVSTDTPCTCAPFAPATSIHTATAYVNCSVVVRAHAAVLINCRSDRKPNRDCVCTVQQKTETMTSSTIALHYFPIRGLAEQIRMTLVQADIPYALHENTMLGCGGTAISTAPART